MASAHVGGTPGWKALRGICPVCKRDVATGPDYRRSGDPLLGQLRLIKRHGSPVCKGVGRNVRSSATWHPTPPGQPRTADPGPRP